MINTLNNEYAIVTDGEVASMLAHFDKPMITAIIEQSLNLRVTSILRFMPNIASSFEAYFKQQMQSYEDYSNEIRLKSEEAYYNIIEIISRFYNMEVDTSGASLASSAIHIYDLFISRFQVAMIDFFVNHILAETNGIYDQLELSQYKKSKDSSTIYNKKIWKNSKLSLICANLELVLDNICCQDISFEYYVNTVYKDNRHIGDFLLSILSPRVDFFKFYIAPWFSTQSEFRSPLITDIRLALLNCGSRDLHDIQIALAKEGE